MNDQNTINELDVEKQREYATMLDKAMELSRRAMREARIDDASHAAAELVVSLKRSLKTGYQHFVEWAKTLKPTFDERDCAFATRGVGTSLPAVAFTKEGYGCSLSFSVQDVQPESVTMQMELFSHDGSRLYPFDLAVMDADTNEFYFPMQSVARYGSVKLPNMTAGNYCIVAKCGEKVATIKHRIDGSPDPKRIVEKSWPLIDCEVFMARFGGDEENVKAFFKEMLCYLAKKTNSKEWEYADRDVAWGIFLRKILAAFSDMTRDIENIYAYGKTVLSSVIHTIWKKIQNRPPKVEVEGADIEGVPAPTKSPYAEDELASENKDRVAKLLSTLSPNERMVVILRVMYDIPSVMVAECLGIKRANTVDVIKLRALEKMRTSALRHVRNYRDNASVCS